MKYAKYFDHTILKANATQSDIEKLCDEAKKYNFASVCVNPYWVPLASDLLKNSTVKVCTVIGFPLGQSTTEPKFLETIDAVKNGAGLYYMYNSNNLHFEKMLKESSLKPIDKENAFVKSYPYGIAKELDYTDPAKSFQIGELAKGRIIREAVGRQGMFKFIMPPSIYGTTDFPFSRYADPLQLKMLLYIFFYILQLVLVFHPVHQAQ